MSHACHRFWKCHKTLTFCSLLTRCTIPCACLAKRHLNVQKWSEPPVLTFWLRNVLRATTVHLNFQKWSAPGLLCTFWLRNALCATTACTFSTLQLLKVVRTCCVLYIWLRSVLRAKTARTFSTSQLLTVLRSWGVLYILTWKCASCHNRRAIFHLSSGQLAPHPPLQRAYFWTLRSLKSLEKHSVPTFSRTWIFFLLTLSLSSSLLFSDSSHLCFSSAHIVRSLTSKLPSITNPLLNPFLNCTPISLYFPFSFIVEPSSEEVAGSDPSAQWQP